jgi:small subunit ribosomal protein S16
MLAIRMQRTGRKGHAQYRVVVQDSRLTPTSGRVVAQLGSYNPHTKAIVLDKEKATFYLTNGAQPSDKVARLLGKEGVKLPAWVTINADGKRDIKNLEKLRKNRPAEPEAPSVEASAADTEQVPEAPTEEASEEVAGTAADNTEEAAEAALADSAPESEKSAE